MLFCAGGRLRCRICHDLIYASTREDVVSRALRRAERLRRKPGSSEVGRWRAMPPRPPRMRWTTYERIIDQIVEAEDGATAARCASIESQLARGNRRRGAA